MSSKGQEKGNKASVEAVARSFKGTLNEWLVKLLTNDATGINLLRVSQKTGIISKDLYNKIRDGKDPQRWADQVVGKCLQSASLEQVLQLLVLIEENVTDYDKDVMKQFKGQLKDRPVVKQPPYIRPKSRWDTEVARQREQTAVLNDRLKRTVNESNKKTAELANYKKHAEASEAENKMLKEENKMLKEQVQMLMELQKDVDERKKANSALLEQLHKAEAESANSREKADKMEDELVESKYLLVQKSEDYDDLLKDFEKQTKELEERTQELKTTKDQLQTALAHIKALEGRVQGLESTVAAVHQNQQMMMNRYNYNPRAANRLEYFTQSLPPQPAGEVSVLTLPPIKEQGPKH